MGLPPALAYFEINGKIHICLSRRRPNHEFTLLFSVRGWGLVGFSYYRKKQHWKQSPSHRNTENTSAGYLVKREWVSSRTLTGGALAHTPISSQHSFRTTRIPRYQLSCVFCPVPDLLSCSAQRLAWVKAAAVWFLAEQTPDEYRLKSHYRMHEEIPQVTPSKWCPLDQKEGKKSSILFPQKLWYQCNTTLTVAGSNLRASQMVTLCFTAYLLYLAHYECCQMPT